MAAARVDAQCRNTMWRSQQASGKDDWGRQSAWDQSSGECQRRLKGSGSQFLLISSLRYEFQHYMSILRCYSKLLIENLLRLFYKTTFIAKQKRLKGDFINKMLFLWQFPGGIEGIKVPSIFDKKRNQIFFPIRQLTKYMWAPYNFPHFLCGVISVASVW